MIFCLYWKVDNVEADLKGNIFVQNTWNMKTVKLLYWSKVWGFKCDHKLLRSWRFFLFSSLTWLDPTLPWCVQVHHMPPHQPKQIAPPWVAECIHSCFDSPAALHFQPHDGRFSRTKQRVYCCLGDITYRPLWRRSGIRFTVGRIQPQLLRMPSDRFCWAGQVLSLLKCEVAGSLFIAPQSLLRCAQRYLLSRSLCSPLLFLFSAQLSSSSCCGRCTCVTLWGQCPRRSTSLATWPSLFTTNSSCRRYSMSSGNSSSITPVLKGQFT